VACDGSDCDDADANPAAEENCNNGQDDNCDGQVEEGCCADDGGGCGCSLAANAPAASGGLFALLLLLGLRRLRRLGTRLWYLL
jgi:MYXO-CTERM domain-containing protein